jgi:parvulin-like peptidyl-prolyl isomerase
MKRLMAAVVGVGALGLVGTACSSDNSATAPSSPSSAVPADDAAVVNGVGLKRSDFEADLQDYVHNTLFVQSGQAGEEAAAGTPSVDFIRTTLQADILFELIRQEVEKRKLTVRPIDDAVVRNQTIARFDQSGSPDIFEAFPKRFQDRALSQTANLVSLQDAFGGGPVDPAGLKGIYDANPRRFGQICVRHILLLSEDDATRVMTALNQGADFVTTMQSESEDTASAPYGGRIVNPDGSCPTASQLDADFATGALAATPGQPYGPVKTKIGWHIILVDSVNVLPFEQVEGAVAAVAEQDVADKAAPQLNQFLQAGVGGSIHVDAKYGTWDPANHQILPPGFRPETRPTGAEPSTSVPVSTTG